MEQAHEEIEWDAIIIGGGAAGLSAAMILGRARRRVLVLDAGEPRNRFADQMHGVLGHDGLPPTELLRIGRDEIARYGVTVRSGRVSSVEAGAASVHVGTEDGEQLTGRRLLVTTGLADQLPDVPGLAERWGRDAFACPYCHGYEVRDAVIGVLATGETSLHQAQLLRQWSDRIIFFSHLAGALPDPMRHRLASRGVRIEEAPVAGVLTADDAISGVELADGRRVEVQALVTAGRMVAHDGFLATLDIARADTPMGTFVTVDAMQRTSNELVYAAGNVTNPAGAVPAAVAEGAKAGSAINWALVEEDFDHAVDAELAATPDPAGSSEPTRTEETIR